MLQPPLLLLLLLLVVLLLLLVGRLPWRSVASGCSMRPRMTPAAPLSGCGGGQQAVAAPRGSCSAGLRPTLTAPLGGCSGGGRQAVAAPIATRGHAVAAEVAGGIRLQPQEGMQNPCACQPVSRGTCDEAGSGTPNPAPALVRCEEMTAATAGSSNCLCHGPGLCGGEGCQSHEGAWQPGVSGLLPLTAAARWGSRAVVGPSAGGLPAAPTPHGGGAPCSKGVCLDPDRGLDLDPVLVPDPGLDLDPDPARVERFLQVRHGQEGRWIQDHARLGRE